jgi:hypothetical protein
VAAAVILRQRRAAVLSAGLVRMSAWRCVSIDLRARRTSPRNRRRASGEGAGHPRVTQRHRCQSRTLEIAFQAAGRSPDTLGNAVEVGAIVFELAAFACLIATSLFALSSDEETAANGFVRLIGAVVLAGIAYAFGLLDPWPDIIRSL